MNYSTETEHEAMGQRQRKGLSLRVFFFFFFAVIHGRKEALQSIVAGVEEFTRDREQEKLE